MAKKPQKSLDVKKFGGIDELGKATFNNHEHEVSSVETSSQTKLEDDAGHGDALVIRCFRFQMNLEHPELFIERRPSKQDIFNSHVRGIEMALWKDGLKLYLDTQPRITFDVKKFQYSIFVAARPERGQRLLERPRTLSELAHG